MSFPQCWLHLQANALYVTALGRLTWSQFQVQKEDKCLLSQEISEFLSVISLSGLACLGHRTLIGQVRQVPPLGTEEMSPLSRPHGLVKGHDSQRKIRVLPPEETETDVGQAKVTARDPCHPNSPMDDHDILCHYPNPPERNQMLWVQIPHLLLYSCDPRASVVI